MAELNFRFEELRPYAHLFGSQEILDKYQFALEAAREKQRILDENPEQRVFEDIVDTAQDGFTYEVPRLDDPRALLAGIITDTCMYIGGDGEKYMNYIFMHGTDASRLMLILDGHKQVAGYCRYKYRHDEEAGNEIYVSTIKYGKNYRFDQTCEAAVRGLYEQMQANNQAGKNPVKCFSGKEIFSDTFQRCLKMQKQKEQEMSKGQGKGEKLKAVTVGGKDGGIEFQA